MSLIRLFRITLTFRAEHVSALRMRISEMREPSLGLEEVPHEALAIFFDEILSTENTQTLLAGLYATALPALAAAIAQYQSDTNPLTDAPSRRVLRFAQLEVSDVLDFGRRTMAALHVALDRIPGRLPRCRRRVLDGTGPTAPPPPRQRSKTGYVYDPVPRRDERFTDPWNQAVNAEAFLYDGTL
jgi:hypothetical protein